MTRLTIIAAALLCAGSAWGQTAGGGGIIAAECMKLTPDGVVQVPCNSTMELNSCYSSPDHKHECLQPTSVGGSHGAPLYPTARYTVAEIDRMRESVAKKLSMDWSGLPITFRTLVEATTATYIAAGVRPEELER